jgi:hypothetical protein
MREQEMRERVDRFLDSYRQRALISAFGLGMTVGGCGTGGTSLTHDPPISQVDAGKDPVGDFAPSVPIYSAVEPADPGQQPPEGE